MLAVAHRFICAPGGTPAARLVAAGRGQPAATDVCSATAGGHTVVPHAAGVVDPGGASAASAARRAAGGTAGLLTMSTLAWRGEKK